MCVTSPPCNSETKPRTTYVRSYPVGRNNSDRIMIHTWDFRFSRRQVWSWRLLRYCAVLSRRNWPTFQRYVLPHRPDDGGRKYLWNVVKLLPDYMAQHPRRQSSSYSPPWKHEISPEHHISSNVEIKNGLKYTSTFPQVFTAYCLQSKSGSLFGVVLNWKKGYAFLVWCLIEHRVMSLLEAVLKT
jgi:hypothetical protein